MCSMDRSNTIRFLPQVLPYSSSRSYLIILAIGLKNASMKSMNNLIPNRMIDSVFKYVGIFFTFSALGILAIFIINIASEGLSRIDWQFLTSLPSRKAEKSGILVAWTGTAWILSLTAIISIPIGISAGIYLEEYGKKNRLASIIEVNIANLAGVPSIIYGLLCLEIFVRILNFGGSLLAGACTLALLILPIILVA